MGTYYYDLYGRTCVEAAYRKTMIHPIKDILGNVSSEIVVEVSP